MHKLYENDRHEHTCSGCYGSIGQAVIAKLIALKLPVTILVRSQAKAEAMFLNEPTLIIAESDVQDAALVNRLASDRDFILRGSNYPYNKWFGNMESVAKLMSSKSLTVTGLSKSVMVSLLINQLDQAFHVSLDG